MTEIVLTTLNAKYAHCAFGLRYLMANLGELQPRAKILEFDIHCRTVDVIERVLAENPKIVGVGVYIWNATQSLQFVAELKKLRPDIVIVLGGPEISHETEQQEITRHADYVITGEGDWAFAQLCRELLVTADVRRQCLENFTQNLPPHAGSYTLAKIIPAPPPTFDALALPYNLYTDEDIAHRVIYVEASRGCPFECEFCLSSLDIPVRNAPLDKFLDAMQLLLERGARQFKFVDRTFNLNPHVSRAILQFFLERYSEGLFVHFEMIPDRLPESLREVIERFPPGALQFEVGIQTFNAEVAARISRKQDNARAEENLRWLREKTGVHIHADLIVGLPGEDIKSFAAGFDRLLALRPHEIQVGILKRLRGAPIARHDSEWEMVYSPYPPYEVLQTKLIDFPTMQRLRRFARYWDLVANSGNFVEATPMLWGGERAAEQKEGKREGGRSDEAGSPFEQFMRFSDWLYVRSARTYGIALPRLAEMLFKYLTEEVGRPRQAVAQALARDYQRGGRSELPHFLRAVVAVPVKTLSISASLRRQLRHRGQA